MCNITDHTDIIIGTESKELKSKDLIRERDYSVSSGGANTFTEEFKGSSTVHEERLHGVDRAASSCLGKIQPQLGGQDHVGSQSQSCPEVRSDSSAGEQHHGSPACDSLAHSERKQDSGKGLERVESSARISVDPGSSQCETSDHCEIVNVLHNAEIERNSVTDVSTSGKNIVGSTSALLTCGSQHLSTAEMGGSILNSLIPSENNHCIENHKQSIKECQTVGTEKCLLIQGYADIGEKRIEWEREFAENAKLENMAMLQESTHKEGTHAIAEGKDITQIDEALFTRCNNMRQTGQKTESLTFSAPSNSFEPNGGNFQKAEPSHEHVSQTVFKSSLNESVIEEDEKKQAMPLEMDNNVTESEASGLLVVGITESKGDHTEPYGETLTASSEVTDSSNDSALECEFSKTRAEEVANNTLQETRNMGKFEQEGMVMAPDRLEVANIPSSEGESAFKIAEFFNNARAVGSEKQRIDEHEYSPGSITLGLPKKDQLNRESSHSLRALLSSEGRLACHKMEKEALLNDAVRKDGEVSQGLHRVTPSVESSSSGNAPSQVESHHFPERWYERAENDEYTSITYSGPIPFSGPISYSGPIPYSGSISHRSDSSTSTRSFAFPILASDWNSSPVKMAQPDSHFYKRRRRRCFFCFCCRRPSTFFD